MKECNWCKSQVNADAKICPNCGKRIWEKKHKKGIKAVGITFGIIFLLLFVVIVILALNSPSVEDKCQDAEFVNLEEVYNLHSKDVPKAEELYKDKYFKFTGTISHKYKTYTQIQSDYVSADVYFSANYRDKASNYNVNDKITYCGKINFGTAIQVKNAMIIDKN